MKVTPIKFIAIPLAILSLALTTGCSSPFGLSDKEKSKYYQATDMLKAAESDFGDTYDKVVDAYFNISIEPEKGLKALEEYKESGLISEELVEECKSYFEYTDSMIGDFQVEYSTNGNPKTNYGSDMSSVFSMIEQLERGWIGAWMYAIPEDDMRNVLTAYVDNNLILDFENGTYQIVDYKTDVYGNIDKENDLSRKLDSSVNLDAHDIVEGVEEEYAEDDSDIQQEVDRYTIVSKDTFSNQIVYKIIEPRAQTESNFTVIIDNGKVVEIDGAFSN